MKKTPNKSGVQPVEYKIIVKPDQVEEVTSGGIIMPDQTGEMQQWAQVKGTLIALGGAAFGHPFTEAERGLLQPGARVSWGQYEGTTFYGADGEEYKQMNDKNLSGIVLDEGALPLSSIEARNRSKLDRKHGQSMGARA